MNMSAKLEERITGFTADLECENGNTPEFPALRKSHAVQCSDTATCFEETSNVIFG
jgi:hypothetical protein